MARLSCPYVKPQLSATTLNIFSVISCPALFSSSLPSLCLCDHLWTSPKHYIFLLAGYLNQLLIFPLPSFKLILTSPGEKGQEAWANQLLECPPHRWSAGERLLPTFFWQEGTASIMAFERKRHFLLQLCCWHFLCLAGFPWYPAAPSWWWQHFPSIWQEKISKVK